MPVPGDHDEAINPNGHFTFGFRWGRISQQRMDMDRAEREAVERADEAASRLMASAEAMTALCDRHSGDSGDDADLIDALGAEIDDLAARIRTALGEPRVLRHGALVPVGMVP